MNGGLVAAIAASYVLVAVIAYTLGRTTAQLAHREAHSWPTVDDGVDWVRPDEGV